MKKQTGVFLARMQPLHNGHIALIEKARIECGEVHVFVGSANKMNERNPVPINIRMKIIKDALNYNNVFVHELNDLTDETDNSHDWGMYLYTSIIEKIGGMRFTIYYSDGFDIITSWFPKFMLEKYVGLSLNPRLSMEDGISATKIREMISKDQRAEVVKHVPLSTMKYYEEIRAFIKIQEK